MSAKNVLHDVNNQLEIIIGAAKTIGSQTEEVNLRERCALIESAVYKISASLNAYFKPLIAAEMERGRALAPSAPSP